MKKRILFVAAILLLSFFSTAQEYTELWGMTKYGGENGIGCIFKTDGNGDNQQGNYSFGDNDIRYPEFTQLCEANNGKLYGLSANGGSASMGVLFEYDPLTSIYSKKLDFNGISNGSQPKGSLIVASNGKIYGLTSRGGVNDMGVLFEYDPTSSTYIKKIDFAGIATGSYPYGSLMQANNGKLYGMTMYGGVNGLGIIFEYNIETSTIIKKIDFDGTSNGSNPFGSLSQASNGKLYGLTQYGGISTKGVLFEYDPSTDMLIKKVDFNGTSNGSNPFGSLTVASNGKLYGMTCGGGSNSYGVLFEYDPLTENYVKKLDFDGTLSGRFPYGSLIQASNGNLYGMTRNGGNTDMGTIFEYNPLTANYIKKIDFTGLTNGSLPQGSLFECSNGKLYGVTMQGGFFNMGVFFEYDPTTYSYTKIMDCAGTTNGNNPYGSLTLAANDNLYGMSFQGGTSNMGVLFEYNPVTSTYSKKLDFNGATNGSNPIGSMMLASNDKLYGMTNSGGTSNMGVLFEYDPTTSTYTKKLDFAGNSSGRGPSGFLIDDSNGKLYGMTFRGGSNDMGVLFEYDYTTSTYTKKIDFAGASSGKNPAGSLTMSTNGKIYGMTRLGGNNDMGVLFEYNPATEVFSKNIDFEGASNGCYPFGSLLEASNGKLYGMTNGGGSSNLGVLFEYDPVTSAYTKLLDFNGTSNGGNPYGSLFEASNGKLYGMTSSGGSNNFGVLFEYDPLTSTYTKKLDFDGSNGKNPYYTHLIEICAAPEILVQPLNASLCPSNDTMFAVNAVGNNLTYQWQVNDGTGFTNIVDNGTYSGASNDTIHLTGVLSNMNAYTYRCEITSDCPAMSIYSDTVLLTVHPAYAFTESHSICQGETYTWQGSDYTEANTYTASYLSVNGCDSIYTLNLIVNPVYTFTDNHSICQGETYTWQGSGYTEANTYTASYLSVNGCDSIYTLNLTVNPVYAFTDNHSICQGETYTWQGTDYTEANTYTASYLSVNGCDSIYTLNLTVNPVYAFTESHSICQGETYTWQGSDYTEANTYIASYLTVNGCDSIYTLNLTVNPVYAFTEDYSVCQGDTYTWQGSDYTEANTYTANYLSVNGCDSIYTLNLTVNPVYAFTEDYSICQGETFTWQGSDYTEANTYTASYLSVNGCDSIYTLNLTVNPTYTFEEMLTLCEGETFEWQGESYTAGAYLQYQRNYQSITGCDSIYILYMNINGLPEVSITGLDAQYCDNITSVQLTGEPEGGVFNGPGVTGSVFNPSYVGQGIWDIMYTYSDANNCESFATQSVEVYDCSLISNEISSPIMVYPNPNSGNFTIDLNNQIPSSAELYNSLGQIIWRNDCKEIENNLNINGIQPGNYILNLVINEQCHRIKIVVL